MEDLIWLVEIDLQNNPIDNCKQICQTILNKKEILTFNLRSTPVALKTRTAEEIYNYFPEGATQALQLLSHYRSDVLYRNKRVYIRIKQQIITQQ